MKLLLVRLSSLGDVVLATAAVEALAAEAPGARVDVLTKPSFRPVFGGNRGVRRVLGWEAGRGVADLARELRREGYDGVVDLHANLRSRLLQLALPGPRWSRYAKGSLRRRAAVRLGRPDLLSADHVVDRYLAALLPFGVTGARHLPRVYPGGAERGRAEELLGRVGWDGREPLVALAPGARWATKQWPPHRWTETCRRLAAEGLGRPVLVGGPEDRALCGELAAAVGGRAVDLAGRTSILETAAVLGRCGVLVTNDSAPLHLAVAVGTPVAALFGPTVPGFGFAPLGPRDRVLERDLPCRPCSLHGGDRCPLGHHRCLEEVGAEDVLPEVRRTLNSGPAVTGGAP